MCRTKTWNLIGASLVWGGVFATLVMGSELGSGFPSPNQPQNQNGPNITRRASVSEPVLVPARTTTAEPAFVETGASETQFSTTKFWNHVNPQTVVFSPWTETTLPSFRELRNYWKTVQQAVFDFTSQFDRVRPPRFSATGYRIHRASHPLQNPNYLRKPVTATPRLLQELTGVGNEQDSFTPINSSRRGWKKATEGQPVSQNEPAGIILEFLGKRGSALDNTEFADQQSTPEGTRLVHHEQPEQRYGAHVEFIRSFEQEQATTIQPGSTFPSTNFVPNRTNGGLNRAFPGSDYPSTAVPFGGQFARHTSRNCPSPGECGHPETGPCALDEVARLRQTSRQLDDVAHQLECKNVYDQADRLRAIAEEIRQQARQMQECGTTPFVQQSCLTQQPQPANGQIQTVSYQEAVQSTPNHVPSAESNSDNESPYGEVYQNIRPLSWEPQNRDQPERIFSGFNISSGR